MKALRIGISMSERMKQEFIQKGGKLLSGYASQENILDGLDKLGIDMDSVNSYQMSRKLYANVAADAWSRNGASSDISIGYNKQREEAGMICG